MLSAGQRRRFVLLIPHLLPLLIQWPFEFLLVGNSNTSNIDNGIDETATSHLFSDHFEVFPFLLSVLFSVKTKIQSNFLILHHNTGDI